MDLIHLIKEDEGIFPTYTKRRHAPEIAIEYAGFRFVNSLGFATPEIVSCSNDHLTTTLIPGESVFQRLESLSQENKTETVSYYLDHLCYGISVFQERSHEIVRDSVGTYDVDSKLADVEKMMAHHGMKEHAYQLSSLRPAIVEYYKQNASVPFRDATPKNYIDFHGHKNGKGTSVSELAKRVYWIDFSSVGQLTLPADDFVSIVFHYMIPENIRNNLLEKYGIKMQETDAVVAAFVRLSRFWVRRRYYEEFAPEHFTRRYPKENIAFYEKQLMHYFEQINRIF